MVRLTEGTETKGWKHILSKEEITKRFYNKGFKTPEEIQQVIKEAIKKGEIVTERRNIRGEMTAVYEYNVKGARIRVVANPETGEIITAYPRG